jgi:hypothetical protein
VIKGLSRQALFDQPDPTMHEHDGYARPRGDTDQHRPAVVIGYAHCRGILFPAIRLSSGHLSSPSCCSVARMASVRVRSGSDSCISHDSSTRTNNAGATCRHWPWTLRRVSRVLFRHPRRHSCAARARHSRFSCHETPKRSLIQPNLRLNP